MYYDFVNFDEFLNELQEKEYVSPGWVASQLNVSRQAIQQWIEKDWIDAIRYNNKKKGRFVYVDMNQVIAFNEKRV